MNKFSKQYIQCCQSEIHKRQENRSSLPATSFGVSGARVKGALARTYVHKLLSALYTRSMIDVLKVHLPILRVTSMYCERLDPVIRVVSAPDMEGGRDRFALSLSKKHRRNNAWSSLLIYKYYSLLIRPNLSETPFSQWQVKKMFKVRLRIRRAYDFNEFPWHHKTLMPLICSSTLQKVLLESPLAKQSILVTAKPKVVFDSRPGQMFVPRVEYLFHVWIFTIYISVRDSL